MLKGYKMVEVPINAFNFCKFSLAALLWTALLLRSVPLLLLTALILLVSYIFKVRQAPLVWFYRNTFEKRKPSEGILIDENAVAFAHIVGFLMACVAIGFLYLGQSLIGWTVVGVLALLKTSGACGYCGAMKLYSCMNNPDGNCCRMGNKLKK
jgi:hypothetical protein